MTKNTLFSAILLLIIMLLTIRLVHSSLYVYVVSGDSMEPVLQHGDVIMCLNFFWHTYNRGDIVVIDLDEKEETNEVLVKQIMGIPGDHITQNAGYLYLNGLQTDTFGYGMIEFGDILLQEGRYYVVGTNSTQSYDSRYFGPVRKDDIMGKYYKTLNVKLPFVRRLG